jgi:hypothetical protein
MAPKDKKTLKDLQEELRHHDITLTALSTDSDPPRLTLKLISDHQNSLNNQTILVTKEQILAGLQIPLYNPKLPVFCQIISHASFLRAIYQMNGDNIRLVHEYSYRAATGKSLYLSTFMKPEYKDDVIDRSQYTVENFFANYEIVPMIREECRWAYRLKRKLPQKDMLLRNVDWKSNNNYCARHSSDSKWDLYPLLLKGNYISGKQSIPQNLSSWCPWVFNWPEKDAQVCLCS